jgi:Fic/DOC family
MTQPPLPPNRRAAAEPGIQRDDSAYDPLGSLQRAIEFLLEIPDGVLNIERLPAVHRLVMPVGHPLAGRWRDRPAVVWLKAPVHSRQLPDPDQARRISAEALSWLAEELSSETPPTHPTILASEIVRRLVLAHPFLDGNGRAARAVGSWVLVRSGYTLVADPGAFFHDKAVIAYTILETSDTGDPTSPGGIAWHSLYQLAITSSFSPPIESQDFAAPFREAPEVQWATNVRALMHSHLTQPDADTPSG